MIGVGRNVIAHRSNDCTLRANRIGTDEALYLDIGTVDVVGTNTKLLYGC